MPDAIRLWSRRLAESACDVAIVGAGPAGCSAAIALARGGLRVVLLEARATRGLRIGETLPPSASVALKELDLWDRFTRGGHLPSVANQSVWGLPEVQSMDFVFSPFGNGWHVDRARFDRMLQDAATDAGATLLRRTRAVGAEEVGGRCWRITREVGKSGIHEVRNSGFETGKGEAALNARFLIDASGRLGWLAARIGVTRHQTDRLLASAAVFRLGAGDELDSDATTLIEAAPYGWWYTAPLPRRRRVAVCFTSPPVCLRDPDSFLKLAATTQHVAARLAKWRLAAGPFVSTANSSHLARAAGSAWLAVGDAAAAHDPISSYGILWALRSGMLAAAAVPSYLGGDATALERYDAAVAESVSVYGRGLAEVYASERRWPREAFWAART